MSQTIVFTDHQKLLPPLELVWILGPEKGKRFALLGGRQTFGRSPDNDVVLPDPTISNHHGVLVYADKGGAIFYDTASRNGISRDGKKAPMISLKIGQQIQIGKVYLKLIRAGQEIDAAQPPKKGMALSLSWKNKNSWASLGIALVILMGVTFFLTLRAGSAPAAFNDDSSIPPPAPAANVRRIPPASRRAAAGAPPQRRMKREVASHDRGVGGPSGFVEASQLTEQAKSAFEGGQLQEAYLGWKKVLEKDPFNQTAQEGVQRLEGMAGKFFEEALMTQTSAPEKSGEKLRLALSISDPSSEVHTKIRESITNGI